VGLWGWIPAFLFTQAVEVPIYVWAQRRGAGRPTLARAAAIGFGASAITHPVVWFAMPGLAGAAFQRMADRGMALPWSATFRFLAFGVLCEGFAVAVEAVYLRAMRVPRPLLWALVANAASASIGWLCWRLTGWP